MSIYEVTTVFLWCTLFNTGLLIFSLVVCACAKEWVYGMHSKFFPLSREAFNTALYCFIGAMKIIVLMLNLVPYLALCIAVQ